mmetsp:Transcript_37947/g.117082  ORF Transcript_37947/g.117082 Transcript_37947/m.117082 type:complete len:338 (+) Transcript_37947:1158-2171(+)
MPSRSSLVLSSTRSRWAFVFASRKSRAAISTASSHLWGAPEELPACAASDWKTCSALLGIAASRPLRASSTAAASSRVSVGSSCTRSGVRYARSARRDRYQLAPSSLSPGTNCRSSKVGSCPRSCLQSEGASSRPKGHSWTTHMPRIRPKNLLQRVGCCGTLSTSAARGVRNPGSGLSCRWPPGAGSTRPSRASPRRLPACARKARVTPPPPSPSSPSSPRYSTRSIPGRSSSGKAASTGPRAELRSRLRSTQRVTLRLRRLTPRKAASPPSVLAGASDLCRPNASSRRSLSGTLTRSTRSPSSHDKVNVPSLFSFSMVAAYHPPLQYCAATRSPTW